MHKHQVFAKPHAFPGRGRQRGYGAFSVDSGTLSALLLPSGCCILALYSMNRDHAVQRIREAGFDAFAHDSWMGECVGCGRVTQESDGVKQCAILIFLSPTKGGWRVQAPSVLAVTDFSQKLTLDDATKLAIGILRSPFLPYSSEDVVLTVARCIGGDGRWIEHKPTGIQRTLFIPVDGKKKEFMTEEQAGQLQLF